MTTRSRAGMALNAFILFLGLGVATAGAASVTTDKQDYQPEEIVIVGGSGFAPSTPYDVPIIRPDGSIVLGDGSFTPGWDTTTTNGSGAFTYLYQCYQARETGFPRFSERTVDLTDQFGTTEADVQRPDRLCNPANKNGEGIGDPTVHGMCYRISEPTFTRRDVLVSNQFGDATLTVLRPDSLCNPAAKDGIPMSDDSNPNHFKCYRVRPSGGRFAEQTVTVADQFETKVTRVLKPLLLCNPVDKNGEGMPDPTCHLVCYRIRDAIGQTKFPGATVAVQDQFTTEDLRTFTRECRKAGFLCVPSTKTELP